MSHGISVMRWEHFPHEADMGIRGIGNTRDEAFEQAALALTAVIIDPAQVNAVETVEITRQAPDDEMLLVDWLNALIYEMATRKLLFGRFEVHVKDHTLTARAFGEPMDFTKHHMVVEIKGATYTALRVAQESNGEWVAQCIVDV
ncbi:MAG TPA: archease [Sulfuricaulis sp.]|nr:archease [Sulfuricaulis sp.]